MALILEDPDQIRAPLALDITLEEAQQRFFYPAPKPSAYRDALELSQQGAYASAVAILNENPRNTLSRDLMGVCLMRIGKIDEAVQAYRGFVLVVGSVHERPEVADVCKRNFATALMLKGLPSGARDVLNGLSEPQHPAAVRLHGAIKQWEKTLSFWRWLDWKTSGIEPKDCRIPIDFEPGELPDALSHAPRSVA